MVQSANEAAALNPTPSPIQSAAQQNTAQRAGIDTAAQTFTSVATPGNSGYKIGPMDTLEISVFQVPELSKTIQVADAGTINFPLIGEVPAAGRTADDLEHDLTRRLGAKYLKNPQVTVFVKDYNSQRVTIQGAVKKQGVFPIRGKTTLLQVIAMADGPDADSDSSVLVFRQTDQGRMAARFDFGAIQTGQANDPIIQAGDVIVVNSSTVKSAFNTVLKVLPVAGTFMLLM